ncbi:MAG TPA: serine/threonine-protein kinase [Polyangia bacterium]|nr:serine/threonine-protein kinase [Polyangia bacterium]
MNVGCLNEERLLAFLEGTISDSDRVGIETHMAACGTCADLLTWAAAEQANRSRSVGREGRPFIGQLAPGSRVDRYQILGAVGRGGMGEVYAAYHPDLDRRIALKVVHEAGGDSAVRRARLLREARAIARLSHPNVVSVYDAGTVDDRVYIAMEFVEGETIHEWLRSSPRSWREVLDLFLGAARGLAAAHAAGVIHRDFKPQNVMIGRDRSVRVMDFGLARLAEEPAEHQEISDAVERSPVPVTVTKTGALIGTVAYMAPEQFRGEPLDARADQFSFCVAFHEALHGRRPALAHITAAPDADSAEEPQTSVPAWVRAIVSRGLAENRDRRFTSMDELIAAIQRGRARPRRRAIGVSVGLFALLVAFGGWRVARGAHINCAVPADRLAAVWSGNDDPRRQSIHRAFEASGLPTADTSWERVSKVLDDYVHKWSAMYVDTCEATHVRGEQSGEVLDLRMSCLAENMDEVGALTTVLTSADAEALTHSVTAVQGLTPVQRCADLAILRSAVPLPRDPKTLETVRRLRTAMKEAQARRDIGDFKGALERALALRPNVEAAGYAPLLAEVLELIGCTDLRNGPDAAQPEETLHHALFTALAAHDDATAAKAAADLVHVVGFPLRRPRDAEMWFHLSESILDRLGPGHERTRAWAANNYAQVLTVTGQLEGAERLAREAVALKKRALGADHPDTGISLFVLAEILDESEKPAEALAVADEALDILAKKGDPDSERLGGLENTKGCVLIDLGRGAEAEVSFWLALRIYQRQYGPAQRSTAFPLQGLGEARVIQGAPGEAISFLERALRIQETPATREPILFNIAETQYWLARALWESGRDRPRALKLAAEAKKLLADHASPRRERAVIAWLAEHKLPAR